MMECFWVQFLFEQQQLRILYAAIAACARERKGAGYIRYVVF